MTASSEAHHIEPLWNFFPKIESFSSSKKKRILGAFGLANHSSKVFFLTDFLRRQKPRKAIFVVERISDVYEYDQLFRFFLTGEKSSPEHSEWKTFTFPFSDREEHFEKAQYDFLSSYFLSPQKTLFILTKEQAQKLFPDPDDWKKRNLSIKTGETISFTGFFEELSQRGYKAGFDPNIEIGEFFRQGDSIHIPLLGTKETIHLSIAFDTIEQITFNGEEKGEIKIPPLNTRKCESTLPNLATEKDVFILDEFDDFLPEEESFFKKTNAKTIQISAFPKEEDENMHLRFLSVLKFYTLADFINDLREKSIANWKVIILSKRKEELANILTEDHIPFTTSFDPDARTAIMDAGSMDFVPPSFQNPVEKIAFLTDREIFHIKKGSKNASPEMYEFLTSLKVGDYIVHLDHGIGKFLGIVEQKLGGITREYLEVEYLENDKLFVPIEYADKVSRYITKEEKPPRLTRLGSAEWKTVQKKVRKETEKIAKELLKVYAAREKAKAKECEDDTDEMRAFEESFPYNETPGQIAAIRDIKKNLEQKTPMDRLVCGDVGFGKTEVAMQAAFKTVQSGTQVAVIAPITILVDQHFQNFKKRMEGFDIRIEMISRFRSAAEQQKILKDLKKGKIDIIIGTHRLLSEDVEFHNLGLLIIDEEQRFGVKQKERFKSLRKEVHILTMTATPIPRTLNLALHKLREISVISTPPPGRLPIITEVRKYSDKLIKEAIEKELERSGQVYFLHNRVETIEAITQKLKHLLPNVRFGIAHGQMKPEDLESKIYDFKEKKFDVLVSSTIIENGIDLANANTMIINKAETFGLSQLYQLRGRIGRSSRQAYAYLLYHAQKLPVDAKKRRAIVEASELGSGFQLAMRDLEIRGAGDILGVSQHGSVNTIGVSHFLRLLKTTIEEMERGGGVLEDEDSETVKDVQLEIPLDAFIPSFLPPDAKEKIAVYQKLAGINSLEVLQEYGETLEEEYGKLPREVQNLLKILHIKIWARAAYIRSVKVIQNMVELSLSKKVTAAEIMNLLKDQSFWTISGENLKTDRKNLGVDWFKTLTQSLELLVPQQKKSSQKKVSRVVKKKKKEGEE